jgi:hypothetical protein
VRGLQCRGKSCGERMQKYIMNGGHEDRRKLLIISKELHDSALTMKLWYPGPFFPLASATQSGGLVLAIHHLIRSVDEQHQHNHQSGDDRG